MPFSEWSRFTCLNSQEQVQDLLCRQAHQWLTGQDVPKRGSRHQNLLGWTRAAGTASLHACDCGHPPTQLTEGHSLHILCVRKMCPFPQWISAHLCPKTVPHAFSLYVDMTVLSQPSAGCVLFSQCGEPFPHSLIFLVRTEPLHGWSGLGMLL